MLEEIKRDFVLNEIQYPLQNTEINGLDSLQSVASYLFDGKKTSVHAASEKTPTSNPKVESDMAVVRELLRPANGTRYIFFTGKGEWARALWPVRPPCIWPTRA